MEKAGQLKVVAVVGSGGMGKTTLAKQVYTKIKGQFDCTAFVPVSQNPNIVKILSDIILQVHACLPEGCNDERPLIHKLREYLQDKWYLIVIDDLWATEAWSIKNSFVENNRGSRVITTTHIERVAQACCSRFHDHVYKIQPLNVPDSRRLFHRRIFLSNDACPEHLKDVSDEILKKCQGVPLAILSVASTLSSHGGVMFKKNWETMRDHLGDPLETDSDMNWMRYVLNLGYNDLSLDLKTCLLYIGIFPEDSVIMKDDLIRRWIAGCFVSGKNTYGPEEIADSYFNELINRNMIQIADYDDCGEVASCRVHDLMLDFIISKSTEENFMTVINGQRSAKGTLEPRQVSVHLSNSEPNNRLENMPLTQVRSFYFWGPAQLMPSFSKFQLLRVLYLDVSGAKREHCYLSSIGNLFQLRYLRTRGIPYKQVLTQLQNLQRLKTLEIAEDDGIDGQYDYFVLNVCLLPSTLLHLIVTADVKLVGGIGRMRSLHTLATLQVNLRDVESMKGLGDLSNLRDLKLLRCTYGVEDTCDLLVSSLCRLSSLKSLAFRGSLMADALTRWSPPPLDLQRLHVLECPFSTVSDWLTQLDRLRSLEVTVQLLPRDGAEILARLTSLVHLRLHTRAQAPEEGVIIRGAMFPYLKNFWFRCKVPCLMFEAGAMPRIQSLTVECHVHAERHAYDLHHGIEHLGSLKVYKMFAYERDTFMSRFLHSSYSSKAHVEGVRKWDLQTLETEVRKVIDKHPGGPDVSIKYV